VAPARHAFKGTLTVKAPTLMRGRHGCVGLAESLSGFSVAFFTHGEHLGPVVRDVVPHAAFLLSPGRVWSEPGDEGMPRAAFPFVLTNPYDNGTHNGLATFLYDDSCLFQLPYMSGFGGNVVVLLLNGISAFRFADGHHYDVDTMVLAGEVMRPFPCPSGVGEAPPPACQPLTADDLRAELAGNTLYWDLVNLFPLAFDGRLTLFVAADSVL
jgi:hypothetical protein